MKITDKNLNIPKTQKYRKQTLNNFDIDKFNQLLEDQGVRLRHYKTAVCPNCKDLHMESHDLNCELCDNGVIHYDYEDFTGIFTTAGLEKIFKVEGKWLTGSALLTAPSDVRLDFFDAIDVLDGESMHSQLIKRGDANIDRARYKITEVNYMADSDGQEYHVDTDFKINKDGRIEWISDNRPSIGQIYTISYQYVTRYRVVDHIHVTRDFLLGKKQPSKIPVRGPQQVLCRLDTFVDSDMDTDKND